MNTLTAAIVFCTSWWIQRPSLFTPHGQYTDLCCYLPYLSLSTQILTFHTSWSIHWPLLLSSIPLAEYTDPHFLHLMVNTLTSAVIFHTSHGVYTDPYFSHSMVNTLTSAVIFHTSLWVHRSSLFTPHGQYKWPLLLSSISHGEYTDPHWPLLLSSILLLWYSRNGWQGIKHQVTYIFRTSRRVHRSSLFTPHAHWPLPLSFTPHRKYTDPHFFTQNSEWTDCMVIFWGRWVVFKFLLLLLLSDC